MTDRWCRAFSSGPSNQTQLYITLAQRIGVCFRTTTGHWLHRRTEYYCTDILKSEGITEKSVPNLHGLTPTTQVIWRSTGSPGTHPGELLAVLRDNTGTKWSLTTRAPKPDTWAGFKTTTDYKRKTSSAEVMSASLSDELNIFYACYESNSPVEEVKKAQDPCPPVISRADVCRSLKKINTRKAPGPDGIPGWALKVCADQLADVFIDILNLSLLQSVVPTF